MMRMGRAMGEFYTGSPVYARPMPRLTWAALAASVLFAGCAPGLSFPNATADKPLTVPAYESKPDGAGPFPAVVLMHGCHGISRSTHDWARWFRERGYVALIVDSWTPRGIKDGCVPGPDVPSTERFNDAVGALRWLHSRPYVDPRRVGVVGWSNGGVFAMALVNGPSLERARQRGVEIPAPGFAAWGAPRCGRRRGAAGGWGAPGRAGCAGATLVPPRGPFHSCAVGGRARVVLP